MTHKNGFTLIELLITISIITILSIIAFPSFSNLINERKLASSFKELSMTLTNARSEAVTLKKNVDVQLNSSDSNTLNILNWNPISPYIYLESGSVLKVTFAPNGGVQQFNETSMIFVLCNSNLKKSKSLQLTRMGSLNILADGVC